MYLTPLIRGKTHPWLQDGEGYLCTSLKQDGELYHIVNVYAVFSLAGKRLLWAELAQLKGRLCGAELCIGGDFNVVLARLERK